MFLLHIYILIQLILQVLEGQYQSTQKLYFHLNMFKRFGVNHKQKKFFKLHSNYLYLRFEKSKFEICFNYSEEPFNHYLNLTHGFVIFFLARCHIRTSIGSLEVNIQTFRRIAIYTSGFNYVICFRPFNSSDPCIKGLSWYLPSYGPLKCAANP